MAAMALFVLAACTAQPVARPTLAPEPTDIQATVAPPTVATASQPTLSAATDVPPIAATNVAPSVAAPAGSDAIPIGRTPEGYNYLGSPNAPVTIIFYSDFF